MLIKVTAGNALSLATGYVICVTRVIVPIDLQYDSHACSRANYVVIMIIVVVAAAATVGVVVI